MKRILRQVLYGCGISILLQAPFVWADAPSQPISTSTADQTEKGWKEYDNHIVKAHIRIKTAWTVMEFKETKESGSVSFTLSRAPAPLVTFSISREPMQGQFEEYLTSTTLSQLYPAGHKSSPAILGGRKVVLIKGKATDDRLEENFFSTLAY